MLDIFSFGHIPETNCACVGNSDARFGKQILNVCLHFQFQTRALCLATTSPSQYRNSCTRLRLIRLPRPWMWRHFPDYYAQTPVFSPACYDDRTDKCWCGRLCHAVELCKRLLRLLFATRGWLARFAQVHARERPASFQKLHQRFDC